ncbi:MAG: hypothetical protein L6Q99_08535 [Planctomycetes bacterium]|nr:hypothetical protein [Planctomycetota bacterium]
MKNFVLPLALLVPLAACSKSEADTKSLTEQANAAVDGANAKLESIDFSKLTPEALKSNASTLFTDLGKELEGLKDAQGAKDLVAKFQPMLDQLGGLKDKLAGNLDTASIQKMVSDVTAKFSSNEEIMKVLQPLLDKVKSLVGG